MSPESIRNRFLGSKKQFTERELQYLTEIDGLNHYALGLQEKESPMRGVGVIRIVRNSENPLEAEVAITIIDEYQKLGLGTLLLYVMVLAALERKIERLSFTFRPQNQGIYKLIEKIARPEKGQCGQDSIQMFLDIKSISIDEIKSKLSQSLPLIDKFHLKN